MITQMELPIYGDYVADAIKDIRMMSRINGKLCVRFSGGKDSIVTKWLFDQARVDYECRFSRTSVDPPELLRYICKYHPDVIIEKNRTTIYKMIIEKGFPPTRVCRYCCQEFKERNTCPHESLTVTGVRNAESKKRSRRHKIERCQAFRGVTLYHPIIKWTEEQVWKVILDNHLPYPSLYDEGFDRIGCVGCPITSARKIKREFERWPNFEKAYLWAFEKMLEGRSFDKWKSKYDVMDWYIYGVREKYREIEIQGQQSFAEDEETNLLYFGDYYEHKPHEDMEYSADDARKILIQ